MFIIYFLTTTQYLLIWCDNLLPRFSHSSLKLFTPHDWRYIQQLIKVRESLYRPCRIPEDETPRFQDNRHMKVVRLSALRTVLLYPQEMFLVLISVRGGVDPMTIMRPEGICQWIIPVTPSGMESATFRFSSWQRVAKQKKKRQCITW